MDKRTRHILSYVYTTAGAVIIAALSLVEPKLAVGMKVFELTLCGVVVVLCLINVRSIRKREIAGLRVRNNVLFFLIGCAAILYVFMGSRH
jgi:hypothetical protein